MRLDEWLSSAARARPGHAALVAEGRTLTYAELNKHATGLARRLAVSPGDRVPAALPPGLAFCELLHALPRRGAALIPLDPRGPAAPALPLGPPSDVELLETVDPEAVHTVIQTSGTTGEPKAVELSYANHAASAAASAGALGVDPADRWLCPVPLHHVAGLNVLIRCVIHRTTAVVHERFDVERVKSTLEAGEVTLASLVPTMLARLRDAGLKRAPGLRAIALGGGPSPAGLLEWAAETGIPVTPVYGLTETCSQVVAGSPGRPMLGVELQVAGNGEILVRGPMVARRSLSADGWLHTGDRGRLDEEGRLDVEGRLKELIVTGGENVAPLEIEQVLLAHPAVADAGVAGLPDAEWGEAVTAFVVLRSPATSAELLDWCGAGLAPFKVPKAVHEVSELPRNASGKLLRHRLESPPA
ncbi:MAG: AMP-binding protein [Thermoleophilaceae bacterium]